MKNKQDKKQDKLYVIKKYIKAVSAEAAIQKDKTAKVDDVWIDDDWKKNQSNNLAGAIGFNIEKDEE